MDDLYSGVLGPAEQQIDDDMRLIPTDDGGMDVVMGTEDESQLQGTGAFDENLAMRLEASALARIGSQIIEWVEADDTSRKEWRERFEKGLIKIGLIDMPEGAADADASIEGASKVIHPMLVEAAVQFQARALEELFPSAGPVKAVPLGRVTKELEEQANRVEEFMNWQVVMQDDSYFWDVDQMLFYLPFGGSAFKKTYFDRLRKKLISRFCKADNIIVPYGAQSGEESRMTHRFPLAHNELLKFQRAKLYRDTAIQAPAMSEDVTLGDRADNATPSSLASDDGDHTMLECHCDIVIPGFDQDGDQEGIAWPYIVTVDKDSEQVVAIYRNWREQDPDRNRRRWFTHYRYLPGLGYYGFGLLHAIGGLSDAATGTLRAFLDAAAFANFQGGFKSKDVSVKGGELILEPGKYKDVECTSEELSKAFYSPDFKQPSPAMAQILGIIVEGGQRFASTTEAMVGEGTNNVPVGTTVARIEQGSKVYTAIHRRLHRAAGEEFKLRAELNAEHIPMDGFPYVSGKNSSQVFRQDFDDRVDVSPVSDPNIFSATQRIAIAQAELQLAQSNPNLYNMHEMHKRMLTALKSPDIDRVLIDPDSIAPVDPITEGQLLLVGKPFRAFLQQAHEAHLVVHMAQAQQFQGTPMGQQLMPVIMAHMAEHIALKYRIDMSMMLGMQLPDPMAKDAQPLPPEIENAIAMKAAQAIQQLQAQMAAQQQQQDPAAAQAEADSRRKDELAKRDIDRKDVIADREQKRKDAIAAAEQRRKDAQFQSDQAREGQADAEAEAQAVLKQSGVQGIEPRMLADAAREMKMNMQDALELLMRLRSGGQTQGAPQTPVADREV